MVLQYLKKYALYGLVILCVVNYFYCSGSPDASQKNTQSQSNASQGAGRGQSGGESIPVRIEKVRIDTITNYIQKTTTLEAERKVEIISKASGHVVELATEEGRMVTKDQALARLDEREASIALKEATIRKENAEGTFERSKRMLSDNLISKEAFESSKFEYETAVSQLERAKLNLEYTSIQAPFTGTITKRSIEIGDMVKLSQSVFEVADFRTLLAKIYVPEKEIRKITDKQSATITSEVFPDRSFYGKVRMISPIVDSQSGTVKVTVEINNPSALLQPGMFISVTIITEVHPRSMVIPKKALVLESQQDMVFTNNNGLAKRRTISIGLRDNLQLEILSGLEPGEDVITVGQDGLRDGSPVRIIEQEGNPVTESTQPESQKSPQTKTEEPAASRPRSEMKEIAKVTESEPGGQIMREKTESPVINKQAKNNNEKTQSKIEKQQVVKSNPPVTNEQPAIGRTVEQQNNNAVKLDDLSSDKVENILTMIFSRRPEVKEEFGKRLEKDPELRTNLDKRRAFIKEMVQRFQKQ